MAHKTETEGYQNWHTPDLYIRMVRQVFGGQIELDPASDPVANARVRAKRIFTEDDDGLEHEWKASSVFLNPPYGRRDGKKGPLNMELWGRKLIEEYRDSHLAMEAILLCNASTSSRWFQMLLNEARAVCLVSGRIRFIDGRTGLLCPGGMYDSAFMYFGLKADKFVEVFESIGTVLEKVFMQHSHSQ